MSGWTEVNFDGLVGPSHHYGGLSFGNRASMEHGREVSEPRAAALQGLEKMKRLADEGFAQAVLPPLARPNLDLLRNLGFRGAPDAMLRDCAREAPEMLSPAWSASSMWTANAATVFPSRDTADGKLRFVPANLASHLHRSTEAEATRRNLSRIFADDAAFAVDAPLWSHPDLGDEGAANHTRFHAAADGPGLHFFVFGRAAEASAGSTRYPARQTETASRAVARLGRVGPEACCFARQSTEAIEAGVFHNDVIAVGQGDLLFCHENAYADQAATLAGLCTAFQRLTGAALQVHEVPAERVSLQDAVASYLFNSQLIDTGGGRRVLVVPVECRENAAVWAYLEAIAADPGCPVDGMLVCDLKQSMRNGGGPACLRLRVAMTEVERRMVRARVFLDDRLYDDLGNWVVAHYRESLTTDELRDPALIRETQDAMQDLQRLMNL